MVLEEHKEITKLLINESAVLIAIVIGTVLQFCVNLQLAHILQVMIFGDFALALQILNFLKPINQMGLLYSITYYVSNYIENESFSYLKGFLQWMWHSYLRVSLIIFVISIAVAAIAYHIFAGGPNVHEHNYLVYYLIWLVPLKTLVGLQNNLLNANYRYLLSTATTQILAFLILNILLFIIYYNFQSQLIYWVIGAYVLAYFFAIIIQRIGLNNLYKKIKMYSPLYALADWKAKGHRLFLMGTIYSAINMADMLMLRILGNNPRELGILAVIFTILLPLVVLNQAIKTVITPLIRPLIEKENYRKLQRIINVTNAYKIIYLIIITSLLVTYGPNLLGLFGKEYVQYHPQLLLAIVGAVFYALFDFDYFLLTYGNREKIADNIVMFQLTILIILDCILIPTHQLKGAVVAIVLSEMITSCVALVYARKFFPVKTLFII